MTETVVASANIDELVGKYIMIRDHIEQAEEEFKKEMERVKAAKAKLEGQFLDYLNQIGAEHIGTPHGTVYRNTQTSAKVEDREVFRAYVQEHDLWHAMDIRANKAAIRDIVESTGEPVPGVTLTSFATVGIRRK